MKNNFSAMIVILLISLFALIYFSCGKNTGANSSGNPPSVLNLNAETDDIAVWQEETDITASVGETIELNIISDINDWEKLGLSKEDQRYIFLAALLNGDTEKLEKMCGLEKGTYDSYKTIKISDYSVSTQTNPNDNSDDAVINMKITESEVETRLSPGEYSYIVECGLMILLKSIGTKAENLLPPQEVLRKWFMLGYYDLYRDFSEKEKLKSYSQAVFDFMQMEINKDYPSPDKNGWTLDAIKTAAKEYFYMDDFDASYIHQENGIYSIGGHGGMVRMYDFIGDPQTDGDVTKITVQFYADPSKTVKSHTIVYTLILKDEIYRFAESKRIYDSPFKPYGFLV